MALSYEKVEHAHLGNLKANVYKVTFDSTYPTGGEVLSAASLGLTTVRAVFVGAAGDEGGTVANIAWYDPSTGKLMLFETGDTVSTDLDEQNTADQSAKSVMVLAVGH